MQPDKIHVFDLGQNSPNPRMTPEQIIAYHLQNIALLLNEILSTLHGRVHWADIVVKDYLIANGAVRLLRNRQQIEKWFDSDSMPLSKFTERIYSCRTIGHLHYPVESIAQTHFLQVEPVGSGYRVRLIKEADKHDQ